MKPCHRVGFGFDSHGFAAEGTLILGGVRFLGTPALKGHSDGDAVIHAIIDALLGAAALGDIGEFFPDTEERWRGADSAKLLAHALEEIRGKGFDPRQIDVTVVADRPRLAPAKKEMRKRLSDLLGVSEADVNIKGKTAEALTWFEKERGGIAAWAVATIGARGTKD